MPFATTTPKQAVGSFSKISFSTTNFIVGFLRSFILRIYPERTAAAVLFTLCCSIINSIIDVKSSLFAKNFYRSKDKEFRYGEAALPTPEFFDFRIYSLLVTVCHVPILAILVDHGDVLDILRVERILDRHRGLVFLERAADFFERLDRTGTRDAPAGQAIPSSR